MEMVQFWRHYKWSTDFISPDLCPPNSLVDRETQSTTEFSDWCRNACTRTRHPSMTPATASSASSTHGKHITICHRQNCWSMEKAVMCMHEGERTSLWTSAKLKPALFRATNSLPRKHVMFCVISVAAIYKKPSYCWESQPSVAIFRT